MIRGDWFSDADHMFLIIVGGKACKILMINIENSVYSGWESHGLRIAICAGGDWVQDEEAGIQNGIAGYTSERHLDDRPGFYSRNQAYSAGR